MRQPAISFIVPVRNDAARLRRCLRSIMRSGSPVATVEMIVADNGSTDGSIAVAREEGAIVLDLPNVRVGELRNRAAAIARADVLAFVDADNEIAPEWVPACLESLARGAAAVGAPYVPPTPGTWVQCLYDRLRRHPTSTEPVEWLGSGNIALRRTAFDAAGGFDTTLETCEDVDLCRKLRARGYVLLADRRLRNIHHGDPRTLREVFFGELWRGRDNVRVSLRAPRSGRTMVSAAVPVANLLAAATAVTGLATFTATGVTIAGLAVAFMSTSMLLRASVMTRKPAELPQALAVAAAYEAGRSLALAGRFGHARRRAVPAEGVA